MTSPSLTRPLIRTHRWAAIRSLGPPAVLVLGLCAWALGVGQLKPPAIGSYGLLASADPWFLIGLGMLVTGFLIELQRSDARGWVLGLGIVAVIVAIHATVPIVYGTPEYAWVYKHIGVALALGQNGRVTDTSSIYQQWPALFAATAALSALAHVGPQTFATWTPLAFELAEALVLLATFRLLSGQRRIAYLAVLLYEGLISWVGQDYLSPQAFAYLLWLGLVLVLVRWLRRPAPVEPRGWLARLRAPLLAGLAPPPTTTRGRRAVAIVLVAVVFLAIVAAHQLSPYVALAGVAALAVLGLIGPWWLVLLLAAIAGGYLAPRYGLIAHNFGGLFSGGNPIQNASGSRGTAHGGPQAATALIVRGLAACMWLLALAAIARRWRSLGRVAFTAVLAFSPFVVLLAQSYGGEAIYRVYLFSAPWCALLIAGSVYELGRPLLRWMLAGGVCGAALFAGLQGLYGPVAVNAVTHDELAASAWLYAHTPPGSLIVLAADDFPALDTADYNARELKVMPADPQIGEAWLDEGNVSEVESWVAGLGHQSAYVVVSHGMAAYANYFGAPAGFTRLAHALPTAPGWTVVYRNADVTIYRLTVR